MSKPRSLPSGDELGLTLSEILREHPEWERENQDLVDCINSMPRAALIHWLKDAYFMLDGFTKIVIPVAENNAAKRAKYQTILEHYEAIRALGQRQLNLAGGRLQGAKTQQAFAQETNQYIEELNANLTLVQNRI